MTDVVDATEAVDDARLLIMIAIGALEEGCERIRISEDLTCTPKFAMGAALAILNILAGAEDRLNEDVQELLGAVKAKMAIEDAQGA